MKRGIGTIPEGSEETRKTNQVNGSQDGDDFHRQQEAKEQRLVEEECKRQLDRDEALAWKLQQEEEM